MTLATRGAEVVRVTLAWDDVRYAAHVGVRRRVESLEKRFEPRNGSPLYSPTHWSQDIDAACAELAVAAYLDHAWTGERSQALFDVAPNIQVRHTWHDDGCLIVRPRDRDGRYVLVTGHDGDFDLHGWMSLVACKQDRWKVEPRRLVASLTALAAASVKVVDGNTYWKVPASELASLEELR